MLKWQYVFNLNTDNYIKLNFSDLKKKNAHDTCGSTKIIQNWVQQILPPWADKPHVYLHASMLCCFQSYSIQTFRRALTASVDSCTEIKIECPFSDVTNSGRVWRKVSESKAWECGQVFESGICFCHPAVFVIFLVKKCTGSLKMYTL